MYRPPGEIYLDIMEQAFFETPATCYVPQENCPLDSQILFAAFEYQNGFIRTLHDFDWDDINSQFNTSDLDSPDGDDDSLAPKEQVDKLTVFAFDEARTLIDLSIKVLPSEIAQDPAQVKAVMKESKQSLLQIARLPDNDKSMLLLFSKTDDPMQRRLAARHLYDTIQLHTTLEFDRGRVRWVPQVQEWMNLKINEYSGCPAHKSLVEIEGKKSTLLHAFFDKLVDQCFDSLISKPV